MYTEPIKNWLFIENNKFEPCHRFANEKKENNKPF